MISTSSARTGEHLAWHAGRHRAVRARTLRRIWAGHRADTFGVVSVILISAIAALYLNLDGTLIGQDAATQFYPWYGYLGEQLRSFEIPGWNPFQFSGAPFAADPQSGWSYLPAMVVFTVLPLSLAVPAFLFLHIALAGLGAYLLGRALGMPVVAALVAGTAYQLTGPVYGRSVCCPAAMEVSVWTPWVLAGTQFALTSPGRQSRLAWWTVAGFALSQSLAAWLGQGSYYLLLATAAFIAYRTLVAPDNAPSAVERVKQALLHGGAIGAIGSGLAAVGVLPRLDFVGRSNLAGGEYAGTSEWAARISGASGESVFDRLLYPTLHSPGAAVLAIALVGLLVARGRYAAPYFAFLSVTAAILASPNPNPLSSLLFAVLPRFEELHQHWPERVSLVAYIAPAMLAGAAISTLLDRANAPARRVPSTLAPLAVIAALLLIGAGVSTQAIVAVLASVAMLLVLLKAPTPTVMRTVPIVLVVVIATELILASRITASEAPYGGFHRVDLGEYYDGSGAAAFLAEQSGEMPPRFFGYDPRLRAVQDGQTVLYRREFANPATQSLLVNNRATLIGEHDIQGYNPIQVQRYVEFMTALNGHPQDYHDANIFPPGLDSPLLDLLGVKYVIVPADANANDPNFAWLLEHFPSVYEDADVQILENPGAFPRAWIVHDVRAVTRGEALDLIDSGAVNPRQTALVEGSPPLTHEPADPSLDRVSFIDYQSDRLLARVSTGAAGLVVFSEVFDPGWTAFVDGKATPVHLVDHILRAVHVPAGSHLIELRYQTPMLGAGAVITVLTIAILATGFYFLRSGRKTSARPTRLGSVLTPGQQLAD